MQTSTTENYRQLEPPTVAMRLNTHMSFVGVRHLYSEFCASSHYTGLSKAVKRVRNEAKFRDVVSTSSVYKSMYRASFKIRVNGMFLGKNIYNTCDGLVDIVKIDTNGAGDVDFITSWITENYKPIEPTDVALPLNTYRSFVSVKQLYSEFCASRHYKDLSKAAKRVRNEAMFRDAVSTSSVYKSMYRGWCDGLVNIVAIDTNGAGDVDELSTGTVAVTDNDGGR